MSRKLSSTSTAVCNVFAALLGDSHYLFYWLVPAIQPRMLVTLDESLASIGVSVRVGQVIILQFAVFKLVSIAIFQAVDIVGQVGKPRTITGFQTHTTPVLLAHGERAELATDECILSLDKLCLFPP